MEVTRATVMRKRENDLKTVLRRWLSALPNTELKSRILYPSVFTRLLLQLLWYTFLYPRTTIPTTR